jgi:hypothetical protein
MAMVNVKIVILIIRQVVLNALSKNLLLQLHQFVLNVLKDSVLKMEHALTVQRHQTIVNHALQWFVLIVFLDFLEMINKMFARDVTKKLNIAAIVLVLIPAMAVTNQLQIWIQKEDVQTVILTMDGTRTLKPDSVNALILSISKPVISVKLVIN